MRLTNSWEIDKRPKTLSGIVLHPRVKKEIGLTKSGITKNLLFHGMFGNGKTTMAHLIATSCYIPSNVLYLDAKDATPEKIRQDVKSFLIQNRIGKSLIIIDELDRIHKKGQEALSTLIEASVNTNFIFTSNSMSFDGALENRITTNTVYFDLTAEELIEIKEGIQLYYKNISPKPIEEDVLDYLFKTYKNCLRNGVQHLQRLNERNDEKITMAYVHFGDNIHPLLRAVVFGNSTKCIIKELEEYGLERTVKNIDMFVKGANDLKMYVTAKDICISTMDAISNLSRIHQTGSRRVVILGIIFTINNIFKSDIDHRRESYRERLINSLHSDNKDYYE